ncbi:hypothetical protein DMA15_03450 [Streptomyces sp. WAC 01529]|uniref:hypothetical protein n=1 Tax=Streptomyces sp. WAC 01529 TaxID=2203205 RepID=UPI000F6B42B6|nr:hypothetical protein [Streptomyces sp. WAC 01529]AZM51749.1 hypothetical protein DMA15_03450 [Streptomyces sp. WAC 01529]
MKVFGREPALIVNSVGAILSLVVAFNVGLSSAQAGWVVAAISAVFAAIAAALTRPIAPAAFTGLVAVVASTVAAFGFDVSDGVVASVNGIVIAGLMFLTRGQVSPIPKIDPLVPAHPVQSV